MDAGDGTRENLCPPPARVQRPAAATGLRQQRRQGQEQGAGVKFAGGKVSEAVTRDVAFQQQGLDVGTLTSGASSPQARTLGKNC